MRFRQILKKIVETKEEMGRVMKVGRRCVRAWSGEAALLGSRQAEDGVGVRCAAVLLLSSAAEPPTTHPPIHACSLAGLLLPGPGRALHHPSSLLSRPLNWSQCTPSLLAGLLLLPGPGQVLYWRLQAHRV